MHTNLFSSDHWYRQIWKTDISKGTVTKVRALSGSNGSWQTCKVLWPRVPQSATPSGGNSVISDIKLTWNCIGRWVGKWKPMLIWDKTSRKTNWHVPHLPQDSHVLFSFPCCFSVSVWEKREETKNKGKPRGNALSLQGIWIWFTTYSP